MPVLVRALPLALASDACCGLCLTWRRLRALVFCSESQGQLRLRRAGSESRGAALFGWGSRWVVGSGRVLPSPGPGGNQEPAGSATGGGFRGCRGFVFAGCTPGRTTGRASPARRREHPTSARRVCAALRAQSAARGEILPRIYDCHPRSSTLPKERTALSPEFPENPLDFLS